MHHKQIACEMKKEQTGKKCIRMVRAREELRKLFNGKFTRRAFVPGMTTHNTKNIIDENVLYAQVFWEVFKSKL